MSARNELLIYMATTVGTIAVLFGLQQWYASYLDVYVVHGEWEQAPMNEALKEQRASEARALADGKLSLAQAKEALATRGRVFPPIAPQPSEDLSAMSGWVRRKNFAPYAPRPAAAPAAVSLSDETTARQAGTAAAQPTDQAAQPVDKAAEQPANQAAEQSADQAAEPPRQVAPPQPVPRRGAMPARRITPESPAAARPIRRHGQDVDRKAEKVPQGRRAKGEDKP